MATVVDVLREVLSSGTCALPGRLRRPVRRPGRWPSAGHVSCCSRPIARSGSFVRGGEGDYLSAERARPVPGGMADVPAEGGDK